MAISIALIAAPVIIVFKSLFVPGPLAWGDAPFFFPEGLKELVNEPLAWSGRAASFGGASNVIFLWPLMFLYGLIGSNDLAIRIIFYFPSLIFAGLGTYLLTKYLKLSLVVCFFAVLFFIFNTYFLLLIDGGQVGFALAYVFFPLTLFFLKKFFDNPTFDSFFVALTASFALTVFDPRVFVICVITLVLWQLTEFKFRSLVFLPLLVIAVAALSLYWLYPLVKNSNLGVLAAVNQSLVKWYYPLTLFSPNWPNNLFGVVSRPPLYFVGVPVLIAVGAFRQKKLVFLFLVFAFLSLGVVPLWSLPFGYALRDSTKFFIPLILFGGILIGSAVERLNHWGARAAVYFFVLFLVGPAILGKTNFVLSNRQHSIDFQKIYENLKTDNSAFRSLWVPEKYPTSYETADHPAINAKDLAGFRPFANLNAGEDIFNFLNNENFTDWFRILGIKYLILSDNPRELAKTEKDQKDWNMITNLIDQNENLEELDWGTRVPVYKLKEDIYPKFYAVNRLTLVVGPDLVPNAYPLVPSLYAEDGKWDPALLQGKSQDSVKILFNGKEKLDLTMSFLQKYFIPVSRAKKNEWAYYSPDNYLKYKYELLIRGHSFRDFDYGKGIAFSTQIGEKVETGIALNSDDLVFVRRAGQGEDLHWQQIDGEAVAENKTGLEIVNVFAIVPKAEFEKTEKLTDVYIKHFGEIKESQLKREQITEISMEKFGTLKYKFKAPEKTSWIIMSDNYHSLWQLRRGIDYFASVPVYSMSNGFYVDPKWTDLGIEFRGQENVRWGIYFSVVSGLALAIIYLWLKDK